MKKCGADFRAVLVKNDRAAKNVNVFQRLSRGDYEVK